VLVSIQNRVRLAFAAVLLLGAALSAFVYLNGRAVLEVSEPLLHRQLPLLETLSRLQLKVAEQKPILYEYYATTERRVPTALRRKPLRLRRPGQPQACWARRDLARSRAVRAAA
jgi:hypothetical protein